MLVAALLHPGVHWSPRRRTGASGLASRCRCRSRSCCSPFRPPAGGELGGFARAGAVRARQHPISPPCCRSASKNRSTWCVRSDAPAREATGSRAPIFHGTVAPWMRLRRHAQLPGTLQDTLSAAAFEEGSGATTGHYRILDRIPRTNFACYRASRVFPVTHVEPEEGNHAVLGMDPLSFPVAGEESNARWPPASAGQRAHAPGCRSTGAACRGALSAVFASSPPPVRAPLGVVSAALGMDDLLAAVSRQVAARASQVRLSDRDAGPESALLAGDDREDRSRSGRKRSCAHHEHRFRRSSMGAAHPRALPRYIEQLRSWAAGARSRSASSPAQCSARLLITTGNRRRIQALVEHRTAELQAASVRLHENCAALIDAQRIARLGSWETLRARDGLHAWTIPPAARRQHGRRPELAR